MVKWGTTEKAFNKLSKNIIDNIETLRAGYKLIEDRRDLIYAYIWGIKDALNLTKDDKEAIYNYIVGEDGKNDI